MVGSYKRLEFILDALHAGTWEWNAITNETVLDERWAEILGYTLDELTPNSSETFLNLCHPEDLPYSRYQINKLLNGKTDRYRCEQRMKHKDGHWVWVLDSGQIFDYDEQGTPTKIIGTRQDISDRKQAEAAFKQENERFRALTNASNTGAWEWDEDKQTLWCSPEYFSMLGRNINDFKKNTKKRLDLREKWLDLLHPEDKERANNEFLQYLSSDKTGLYESEFRLKHADGSWVWIWSRGRFLLDTQNLPTSKAFGTHINITERKQYEQEIENLNTGLEKNVEARTAELNKTLEHLQRTQAELIQNEKMASLGALVAGVAHELNTPIGNAVMVSSSLLQNRNQFVKQVENGVTRTALTDFLNEVEESSNIIERNLERAAELIKSFKQLAVDQTSYQRRQFSLKTLVDEVCLTLNPSIRQTNIQLLTDIPEFLTLDSFPGPLGQVLINLINNAIIHAFTNQANGQIKLTAASTNEDWLVLMVNDNGTGIPLKNRKKIFDPFFTTKLGHGGSGLGLHITYSLVSGLLGGRIELNTAVTEGTEFQLKLPLKAPTQKSE